MSILILYLSDFNNFKFTYGMGVAYVSDLPREMFEAVLFIVLNGYIGRECWSILLN